MIKLVCLKGENKGQEFQLEKGRKYFFGRDHACDFPIRDNCIARQHFLIDLGEENKIAHLGTANGTYVNSSMVTEQVLRLGDVIRAGSQEWQVVE